MEVRGLGVLEVGALGLGCSGADEAAEATEVAEVVRTVHRALELGITLLDVAEPAGEIVGRAIRGRRDDVVLATTSAVPPHAEWQACEALLRRLGVDHVDLYCAHGHPTAPVEETVGALAELVAEGKVRHLGLGEVDADVLRRAHAVHPVTAVRSEWSPWSRAVERAVPTCRELGVGVVAHTPLGRGFLAARHPSRDLRPSGEPRPVPADDRAVVEALRSVAFEHDTSPVVVAPAWVHHRGAVPVPVTRRVAYLEDYATAADLRLTPEQLTRIG